MKAIKVSIILPVYNAGIYLKKCLDTLINQTLKEIEIIVILACPTDGSDKIVTKYAIKDDRIVVVKNEKNLHIGNSRNIGLLKAKGKYIGFCDHDDYVELTMCEELYNIMEKNNYDLVCSNLCAENKGKIIKRIYPDLSGKNAVNVLLQTVIGIDSSPSDMDKFNLSGAIWSRLFRNEIIRNNNIKFVDTNECAGEDYIFWIEYLTYSNQVGFINKNLYYHVIHSGNTSASSAYINPDKVMRYIILLHRLLSDKNLLEENEIRFKNTIQSITMGSIVCNFLYNNYSLKKTLYAMRIFRKSEIVIDAFLTHKDRNPSFSKKGNVLFMCLKYYFQFFGCISKYLKL